MTLSPPTPLRDAVRLDALQRLDQFRAWRSLDDKRYCLVCGKIITGRQIQVADTRGNGQSQLSCPTERCSSIPMDWVLLTDEILAVAEMAASQERSLVPLRAADHGAEQCLTSQLRNSPCISSELPNA